MAVYYICNDDVSFCMYVSVMVVEKNPVQSYHKYLKEKQKKKVMLF